MLFATHDRSLLDVRPRRVVVLDEGKATDVPQGLVRDDDANDVDDERELEDDEGIDEVFDDELESDDGDDEDSPDEPWIRGAA